MKKITLFILGAGIGTAISLLFAPKSGKETIADAKSTINNLNSQGHEIKSRFLEQDKKLFASFSADCADDNDPKSNKRMERMSEREQHNAEIHEKIETARRIIADQVERNAAQTHDVISKTAPMSASDVNEMATAAYSKPKNEY